MCRSRMENLARFIQHLLSVPPVPSAADASAAAAAGTVPQAPTTKIVICYTDLHEVHDDDAASSAVGTGGSSGSFLDSMIDRGPLQHGSVWIDNDSNDDANNTNSDALATFCAAYLAPNVGQSRGIRTLTALLHLEGIDVVKVKSPTSLLEPLLPFQDTVVLLPNIDWLVPDSSPRSLAVLDPILAFSDVYIVNSLQQLVLGGPLVGFVPRAVGECYLGSRAVADVKRFADIATATSSKVPSRERGPLRKRVLLLGDMDELSGAMDDPMCDLDAGGRHVLCTGKSRRLCQHDERA